MIFRALLIRLTVFYLVVTGAVLGVVAIAPALADFLPIGGAQTLLSETTGDPLGGVQIGAENFVVPVDFNGAQEDAVRDTSVSLQSILRGMELRAVAVVTADENQ